MRVALALALAAVTVLVGSYAVVIATTYAHNLHSITHR